MSRTKILLADDHKMFAQGLRSLLEDEFELVGVVENGQALLDAVGQSNPDVIVADISMPVMNGLDAVRSLKLDLHTRDIPVVALTAQAMAGDEQTALGAGFDGYITKPINTRTLSGEVRRWLKSPEAERERRKGA